MPTSRRHSSFLALHSPEHDSRPQGVVMPFPDLATLTPERFRGDVEKTTAHRLLAFMDVVRSRLKNENYPFPACVWVHPLDEERLYTWVAQPLKRRYHAKCWHDMMGMFWLDRGPASSVHVAEGTIVVTPDAFERARAAAAERAAPIA